MFKGIGKSVERSLELSEEESEMPQPEAEGKHGVTFESLIKSNTERTIIPILGFWQVTNSKIIGHLKSMMYKPLTGAQNALRLTGWSVCSPQSLQSVSVEKIFLKLTARLTRTLLRPELESRLFD
jgi:hypothetical protein